MSKYKGKLVNVDPRNWAIVGEVLYLNYSKGIQKKWNKERTNHIKRGNKYWQQFLKSINPKKSKEKENTK